MRRAIVFESLFPTFMDEESLEDRSGVADSNRDAVLWEFRGSGGRCVHFFVFRYAAVAVNVHKRDVESLFSESQELVPDSLQNRVRKIQRPVLEGRE